MEATNIHDISSPNEDRSANHNPVDGEALPETNFEKVDEDFLFSYRRLAAMKALVLLVAISVLPLYTIPSAFCDSSILTFEVDFSIYYGGNRRRRLVYMACNGHVPCFCCGHAKFRGLV